MDTEYPAIIAVLNDYFDGLYHSDTTRLRQVFHEHAQYVSASDGKLLYRTMPEYFAVVDTRPSPASRNEARQDEIVSITFAGPVTATAIVHCAIAEKYFTDCLTLIWTDNRWQIISKVFHSEPRS